MRLVFKSLMFGSAVIGAAMGGFAEISEVKPRRKNDKLIDYAAEISLRVLGGMVLGVGSGLATFAASPIIVPFYVYKTIQNSDSDVKKFFDEHTP